ncbi:MAG: guanylate kinase [Bacteroidia bacterium]|nr:guanylate kinase [Bacteroidia bacterium]
MKQVPKQSGKIIIFSAPSGAGKSTIVFEVLKRIERLEFSVSATTRPKRNYEINGRDYYFISIEKFRYYIEKDKFLEWQEVYPDRFYGTFRSEVDRIVTHGNSAVFDVDVQGGINLKKIFQEQARSFFIQPPSLEVLRQRLEKRNTETPEELDRRIKKAAHELTFAPYFDEIILNDDLGQAIQEIVTKINLFIP